MNLEFGKYKAKLPTAIKQKVEGDRQIREMSHIEETLNTLYASDPALKKELSILCDSSGKLSLKGIVSQELWDSYKKYVNTKAMERSPLQRP